jgi:PAS domain S-box-containing protein
MPRFDRQQLLEQILEGLSEGVCAFDAEWRITYCNTAAAAHAGLQRDQAVGNVFWTVAPGAVGGPLEAALRRAMLERAPVEMEAPSAVRPGAWVQVRAFPLPDGLAISFRDRTARREREERERLQSQRLELALAASGLGDWGWDADTDMVNLSPAAAALFELPAGPVMTWAQMLARINADDAPAVRHAVAGVMRGADGYEIEFRVTPPGATTERWVISRARALRDAGDRITGLQGVVGDISRRKAQEATLRESEARFRAMADSAPAPVWVTDPAGKIEFANQAFSEFSGVAAADLHGDAWVALVHPEDRAAVGATRAQAREGLQPYEFEARFRDHAGQWRWIRASSRPRFDETGEFRGYVGLAVDMTDIRSAEARQQLLINELNHRVKNTLATVQSIGRQTLRDGVATDVARGLFTERLMALSAAHNVLTRENWESAEIADVVSEALRPHDAVAGARIQAEGPRIRVAPRVALALSMALHELATNSAKYGALCAPAGGVSLTWSISGEGDTAEMVWQEAGGPAVTPPSRRGFGSRLLLQGLAADLGQPARLSYPPEGVTCTLMAPIIRMEP